MATPKKKHLIELMIEADVKWPDGAKYAAQDKGTMRVRFYRKDKPLRDWGVDYWSSFCGSLISGVMVKLPELCSNWYQTIVTREQYAEAVAAANTSGKPNQVRESEDVGPYAIPENTESLTVNLVPQKGFYKLNGASETADGAVEWHNPPSIEQLTSDYYAKAAEADRLQSVADEALKDADDALLALEKAGELIGLVISIDTKPAQVEQPVESAQPIITDWRDLRVGDVVDCVLVHGENGLEDDACNNRFHGARCNVVGLTENGKNHIKTDLNPSGYYIQEFKFISRP